MAGDGFLTEPKNPFEFPADQGQAQAPQRFQGQSIGHPVAKERRLRPPLFKGVMVDPEGVGAFQLGVDEFIGRVPEGDFRPPIQRTGYLTPE